MSIQAKSRLMNEFSLVASNLELLRGSLERLASHVQRGRIGEELGSALLHAHKLSEAFYYARDRAEDLTRFLDWDDARKPAGHE